MNRSRFFAACAVGGLIAFGCGDMMYVEVEMPEVCNSIPDAGFPGVDPALIAAAEDAGIPLDAGVQTITYALDFPLAEALPGGENATAGLAGELSMLHVTFIADRGITDFSFLEHAAINVTPPPGAALQTRTILEYTKTDETASHSSIVLEGARFDLMDYMRQGALNLSISLTGRIPLQEWSTTIRACGYVRGRYNYLDGD